MNCRRYTLEKCVQYRAKLFFKQLFLASGVVFKPSYHTLYGEGGGIRTRVSKASTLLPMSYTCPSVILYRALKEKKNMNRGAITV
jgi:hypothetical protein